MSVESLTAIINQILPEPHAGLMSGILYGTKAHLEKELYRDLITTGTLHIIALSGMNITILASLVNLSLLHVINRRLASICTILLIVWFVYFVGPTATIVRASIMGVISLLAVVFGKQHWSLLAWALAIGIMLLIHFSWITDISFQLSALATLGIILFNAKKESKGTLTSFIADEFRLTLSAQVFTIPLIVFAFARISLISPVANVLIGWTIPYITVCGWLSALIGSVWMWGGRAVGLISWVLLEYLITIVRITSKIPFASIGR